MGIRTVSLPLALLLGLLVMAFAEPAMTGSELAAKIKDLDGQEVVFQDSAVKIWKVADKDLPARFDTTYLRCEIPNDPAHAPHLELLREILDQKTGSHLVRISGKVVRFKEFEFRVAVDRIERPHHR